VGAPNANGEELSTYGEDTDGTWIMVNNISCEYHGRSWFLTYYVLLQHKPLRRVSPCHQRTHTR
jgi:hypothetical protein